MIYVVKFFVIFICFFCANSLRAQDNTAYGTGALSQISSPKFAIQTLQVTNPGSYSRPTIDMGSYSVQWSYQYMDVGQFGVYVEGYFSSSTDLGTFVPSVVGGHGSGATVSMYLTDYDGFNYYYEIYTISEGAGYCPQLSLSSSTGNSFSINSYINGNGELEVYYYDYNKTNLYSVAPTVSVAFGSASINAVLEGTAANGQNTAIGYQALYNNVEGKENTALGHQALLNSTGNNNIGLGYLAGKDLTTGNNNIFIGRNAGLGISTGSGNLFLGNGSNINFNNLSNSVILADGNGSPKIVSLANGNTKIGFANDFSDTGFKLDVNGHAKFRLTLQTYTLNNERGVYFMDGKRGFPNDAKFFIAVSGNEPTRLQYVSLPNFVVTHETNNTTYQTKYFYPLKGVDGVDNDDYATLGQLNNYVTTQNLNNLITSVGDEGVSNSSLVRRSSFGSVNASYLNMNSPAVDAFDFTDIVTTNNDGFLRRNSFSALKLKLPITLQDVVSRDNMLNHHIVLGNNAYFRGAPSFGFRFNDYNNLNNNFIIHENGNTYTRGHVMIGSTSLDNAQSWDRVLHLNGNNHSKILVTENSGVKVGLFAHVGEVGFIGTESDHDLTFMAGYWNKVMTLKTNGNIGIGTQNPQDKLSVNGRIRARELKIEPTSGWPDYVFSNGYKLMKLNELAEFIKRNRHLPGIPSANEVEKNGYELGEMNKLLLKKIEELTLYLIEKDKLLEETIKNLSQLRKEVEKLNYLKKENEN